LGNESIHRPRMEEQPEVFDEISAGQAVVVPPYGR
jgi:hypothetical protein